MSSVSLEMIRRLWKKAKIAALVLVFTVVHNEAVPRLVKKKTLMNASCSLQQSVRSFTDRGIAN